MGFIEEVEQMSRERNKKLQEDIEKERRIEQKKQEGLRLQKNSEMEEEERLYRLRREAEVQFNASGLKTMLSRLNEVRAIRSFWSGGSNVKEEYWKQKKLASETSKASKDGSFHTKVVVSDETRNMTRWTYVSTEKFFNIITDSTGLITFKYGTILPRHKEIQRSVWTKSPNLLEELLKKAFISPRTIMIRGEYHSSTNLSDGPGFST